MLRTNRAALMQRADELGVSLVIRSDHDGAMDTQTFRCADGFVDPLLARRPEVTHRICRASSLRALTVLSLITSSNLFGGCTGSGTRATDSHKEIRIRISQ